MDVSGGCEGVSGVMMLPGEMGAITYFLIRLVFFIENTSSSPLLPQGIAQKNRKGRERARS